MSRILVKCLRKLLKALRFVANARMRSVANLSTYFDSVTSLVTVRETVYILGGHYFPIDSLSYASIVAISLLDDELYVVTLFTMKEMLILPFSKAQFSPSVPHFLI